MHVEHESTRDIQTCQICVNYDANSDKGLPVQQTITGLQQSYAPLCGLQVPVTLVVQYQAVDYSNGGQLVTNSQTVKDFLTATGFAGTFGTWNTQNSTLTVRRVDQT